MSSEIQENEIEAVTEKRKNFMRFLKCEFTDLGNCSPPTQPLSMLTQLLQKILFSRVNTTKVEEK